ncbi:OTU deubiquitinase with linear linkage specificity a [Solea solea]|uniref:OTU deubiquitinase with linear linkage specificity a n=1 Tax=Solea solea TaxID=90069 RepID=UPI00272D17E4|nr:OTU deubiquitinase with linear linkage specificity a [Solea solea]
MSWLKSVKSHSSEDVFDENADELTVQRREWTTNMKRRLKDGYVDGADAGEELALQLGFNQGYKEGAAQTVSVGRLKGIVSAIWCWCQIQHPENPVPASVTDLLQQVSQHEDKITEGIRKAMENPPPSVSDVSEIMEDLEVKQVDRGCSGESCEETDCCKRGENMELDDCCQPQKLCSGTTDHSFCSDEGLHLLVQRCVDVVAELELPQELISHIQELEKL